jgi:excisionase family DNA binding protein
MTERKKVEQFYTLPQAAKMMKMTRQGVHKLVRRGRMKSMRVGRDYLVTRRAIDGYLKNRKV